MKKLLRLVWAVLSSRFLPPLVIGIFLLVYIGIAFFTDETLTTLMAFTRANIFLAALLALIPLNYALRMMLNTVSLLRRRQALAGGKVEAVPALFDETLELAAAPIPPELEGRLVGVGYKVRRAQGTLAATKGFGIFPARLLYLAASFCLFTGILLTTTSRSSQRGMVVEGDPFPAPNGSPATVQKVRLGPSTGSILARTLTIDVVPDQGGSRRSFGLYPPSLYGGAFVYPRYLGIGLHLRFFAPDLPQPFEDQVAVNLYPQGKEGSVAIPDSPYRLDFSISQRPEGEDPYGSYMVDRKMLEVKVIKGRDLLFSGSLPSGGSLVRDGYRIELPEVKRLVVTDFIGDYGVLCVWAAGVLYLAAAALYLPLRIFSPKREMLFMAGPVLTTAHSRAEGRRSDHAGVFHDALDMLDAKRPCMQQPPET